MTKGIAEKIKVTINDTDFFDAWVVEESTNGWGVPFFEKKEADRVATIHACTYNPADDTYQFKQDDVVEDFEGLEIETPEGPKKVYSIGGGTWIWDQADEAA
jgi:hypothetical protein